MTLSTVDLNLPWSCAENGASIVDADGAPAAYGLSIDETPLIVRAVNTHERLVELLRMAMPYIDTSDIGSAVAHDAREFLASLE